MNFTLRCVRFYPGVNSCAELITLAPGLTPETAGVTASRTSLLISGRRQAPFFFGRGAIEGQTNFGGGAIKRQTNFLWGGGRS